MQKRRVIEPSQLRIKRRRRRNIKIIFWLVLILVIVFGLGFLTHLKAMTVSNIEVEGNASVSTDDLVKIARDDMNGNLYLILSKSNIFLYPKTKIENDILSKYKQIGSLSIKRADFQTIRLSLGERKPSALWCADTSCYFMDQTGYVFANAPALSGNLYFTYYGLINSENPIGTNFLPSAEFKGFTLFLNNVKKLGINVNSLRATNQHDFELNLDNNAKILFTDTQPFDETLSNLQTVIDKNNPSGNGIDLSETEYVNLRLGNKIIYKLKGQATTTDEEMIKGNGAQGETMQVVGNLDISGNLMVARV